MINIDIQTTSSFSHSYNFIIMNGAGAFRLSRHRRRRRRSSSSSSSSIVVAGVVVVE